MKKGMSMYKKFFALFALLCTLATATSSATPWLEVKPSYFFFFASPMHHIYSHGGFELQGSASVPVCHYLDLYGSIGYRRAQGRALNSCEKTSLAVIPIDIGLKPVFNFCERFHYFFAVGPRYFYFHQHNNSRYVACKINGSGIGLFVNTGITALFADCCVLGIFGEYSYEKKTICPSKPNVYSNGSVQMGGFAFGISLGYAF